MRQLLQLFESWMQRIFQTPETTFVFLLGAALISLTALIGNLLLPVFISIGISYVMVGLKLRLVRLGLPALLALSISYALFLCLLLLMLFLILPLMIRQVGELASLMPDMYGQLQEFLSTLLVSTPLEEHLDLAALANSFLPKAGTAASQFSASMLGYLGDVLTLGIYLVIVPIMVFFLMKDYDQILKGLIRFLPGEKALAAALWRQIDEMLSNYVRGKVVEIIAVWFVSQIFFMAMGLEYATLLALLTGLSVVVPFVGAMVVTLPVASIALLQWGLTTPFWILLTGYTILQLVDGYILVPLIFSETMKIPPLITIISVLIFGGLWGFWGAFLAIPMTTLIKILLESWPKPDDMVQLEPESS